MRLTTLSLLALGAVACQRAPLDITSPAPIADSVTVTATRDAAMAALTESVAEIPLPVRYIDKQAGLLETNYSDIAVWRARYSDLPTVDRYVRFRFMVHTKSGHSTVTVQALQNPWFPRLVPRKMERAAPPGNPGILLAKHILDRVRINVNSANSE